MINADCEDDIALFTKTPAQAESLLYSREQTVRGIGLYMNEIKQTTCFKQNGAISTLCGKPIKTLLTNSRISVQHLISWKWCEPTRTEGEDRYWQFIDQMESDKIIFFFELCLCQYYSMDAPRGHEQARLE